MLRNSRNVAPSTGGPARPRRPTHIIRTRAHGCCRPGRRRQHRGGRGRPRRPQRPNGRGLLLGHQDAEPRCGRRRLLAADPHDGHPRAVLLRSDHRRRRLGADRPRPRGLGAVDAGEGRPQLPDRARAHGGGHGRRPAVHQGGQPAHWKRVSFQPRGRRARPALPGSPGLVLPGPGSQLPPDDGLRVVLQDGPPRRGPTPASATTTRGTPTTPTRRGRTASRSGSASARGPRTTPATRPRRDPSSARSARPSSPTPRSTSAPGSPRTPPTSPASPTRARPLPL